MKIVIPFLILMSLLITETVAQDTPGPPTNFKVTAGDRQLTLTWTHPSNIDRNDISRYRVRLSASGLIPSTSTLWPTPNPEAFTENPSYTFTYYDNGTEITLQGVNLVGTWAELKKQ